MSDRSGYVVEVLVHTTGPAQRNRYYVNASQRDVAVGAVLRVVGVDANIISANRVNAEDYRSIAVGRNQIALL